MILRKYIWIVTLFLLIGYVSATTFGNSANSFNNPASTSSSGDLGYQFTNPSISSMYSSSDIATYWPQLAYQMESGQCEGSTDFLVMIPPGGCSPAVVRSDLLEEQNVPVFCQLESIKVNPLIKVSSIKSISFKGKYPADVAGVSFYPARAALKSYTTLLGSPIANNIGYVVLVLKKQNNESSMSKNISGNLTATMYYDAEKAFGVGASEFYLQMMNENEWATDWVQQTFWAGRGVMRLVDIQKDEATVEVLSNDQNVIKSFKLKVGETSSMFYFPGFYCQAGLQLKLNSIVSPDDSVVLNIDGTTMDARAGTKFLNGRCTVMSVDVLAGETGTVKIRCDKNTFDLSLLNAYKANLTVGDKNIISNLGGVVSSNSGDNVYLAYTGFTKKTIGDVTSDTQFVVLIKSKTTPDKTTYSQFASKIDNTFNSAVTNLEGFKKSIGVGAYSSDNLFILFKDEGVNGFGGVSNIHFNGFIDSDGGAIGNMAASDTERNKLASNYFDKADEAIQDLLKQYPTISNTSNPLQSFGEEGLMEEMGLINQMKEEGVDYSGKKIELMNKFLEIYPDSKYASNIRRELAIAQRTDSTNAYKTIYANNDYHSVGIVNFKPADSQGKTVEVLVDGKIAKDESSGSQIWHVADRINLSRISGNDRRDYLVIKDIKADEIVVDFYTTSYDKENKIVGSELSSSNVKILFGEDSSGSVVFKDFSAKNSKNEKVTYRVALNDLNVEKVAYVSLVSNLKTSSEANFTYNIGVEKRAIELSPEKATTKADELNKTIQKWEEKNARLGDLVEKWKGVCLATGLALQIKNFVSGLSGESFARQNVMTIYKSKCSSSATNPKTGNPYNDVSADVCYNSLSEDIAKDVDAYANAVESVNEKIGTYDGDLNKWKASGSCSLKVSGCAQSIEAKDLSSWADVRQCLLNQEIRLSSATQELIDDTQTRTEGQLRIVCNSINDAQMLSSVAVPKGYENSVIKLEATKQVQYSADEFYLVNASIFANDIGGTNSDGLKDILQGIGNKPIGIITTVVATQPKLIIVQNLGASPVVIGVYDYSVVDEKYNITAQDKELSKQISVTDGGKKCAYKYENKRVLYYDSDPNKGMPAIVPIDLKEGWYVSISQSQGGLTSSSVKGYQGSGVVQFYYLCNVGANGREDLRGNDDICQSFNYNNYNNVEAFSGCSMSKSKVQSLAKLAEDAIRQVANQYKDGVSSVNIKGVGNNIPVEAGLNSDGTSYQCQDFMSPEDCKIMYNVCDPVICPPSRCNFGGKMPVANVIQSGIIGSLVLCLPNSILWKGDVLIPVCLTGVHAGIEGYVSILKAQQNCLREYAKTGKHVGICDEMTAVYKCEFFWRQASPLIQNIIPNLFEFAYTGSYNKQSGGGEYAVFQQSWNNMQKSLDYFKNTYASTSFTALKFGDVQEIGSTFCQNFIGTSLPTSGKALDAMLKPESPPQFYGKFSEIPLTDATVPATSQYKVYYHIYAGTDQGVRYTVYLKNPPATSYYQTAQTVVVKQGYIVLGEQADEAIDFSAPKGYKELCIVINNQEECGFQSISTEFTINAAHDLYAKEQGMVDDIETEKECIQGSPSALALINTNVEAGVQEAVDPDIALRGINRVCATKNPGQGTDSTKWKRVGYCGNVNLTCWLDLDSVNSDAMNVLDKVGTIANTQEALSGNDPSAQYFATQEISAQKIESVKSNISKLRERLGDSLAIAKDNIEAEISPVLASVEDAIKYSYLDAHKAESLLLKYKIYDVVVKAILGIPDSAKVAASSSPMVVSGGSTGAVAKTGKIGKVTIESNLGSQDAVPKTLQNGVSTNVFYSTALTLVVEDNNCDKVEVTKDREVVFGIPWFSKNVQVASTGYELGSMDKGKKATYRVNCIINGKTTDVFVVILNAVDAIEAPKVTSE